MPNVYSHPRHATAPCAVVLLVCTAVLLAHHPEEENPETHHHSEPYKGPGYDGGTSGGPPIDFPASGVQLLSWIPVLEFDPGNTSCATVEGYVSPANKEYAVVGLSDGTGFVDVSDPGLPQIVEFIPGPDSLWKDVRVYQQYAYSVSEGGSGIQIMDMSQIDTGAVTLVGAFNSPAGTTGATHTMFINQASGYLYRCGGSSNGLRIYSLADPTNPVFVGQWQTNYVHESYVHSYTSGPYAGKEVCFAFTGSSGGMHILDVTDKANIVQMDFISYPTPSYCHQGWPSEDMAYMYINDELDGVPQTRIIDITDLNNASFVSSFSIGSTSIDHNLYVVGNQLFESNYRSGLRIFDITDPINPVETAYFDTFPEDDNPTFASLWDNYPYLPSGIVLGSDIEKGFFVWSVGAPQATFSYPDGLPVFVDPAGDTIHIQITPDKGASVVPGSPTLYYDTGGGFTTVPLTNAGGDLYDAVFPAIPCGTQVKFYFTAQTGANITLRDPPTAPATTFLATAAISETIGFADDMETDTGWVVGDQFDSAISGVWVRVDPNGTGAQPEDDNSAAGTRCWVTGQGTPGGGLGENDVDGPPGIDGITTLTSPNLDATGGDDPHVVYYRWYSNDLGGAPNSDSMPIEISNNGGSTWTQLELVTENAGAWVKKDFSIADFVTPTNQVRIRFIARDQQPGSVVEAGVDDLRIVFYECQGPIEGDVDGDGSVDIDDLLAVINGWGVCAAPPDPCDADLTGDGFVDVDDLLEVINNWAP